MICYDGLVTTLKGCRKKVWGASAFMWKAGFKIQLNSVKTVSTRLVWPHLDLSVYIIAEEAYQISGLASMAEIKFWAVWGRVAGSSVVQTGW